MRKSKGFRSGSRNLRKGKREKGMPPVTRYLQEFAEGDRVHIDIVSSEHSGMPKPKYRGRTGVVQGKQGEAYLVKITDGNASKTLVVNPVHLKRA